MSMCCLECNPGRPATFPARYGYPREGQGWMSLDQEGGIPQREKLGGDDESWRALDLEAQLRFLAWASEELSASPAWTVHTNRPSGVSDAP